MTNQPAKSTKNHYGQDRLIGDGRGKHTGPGLKLGIRVDDTPQSILPVIVKMTGVTVLIVDRPGFPVGGLALVASQTIFDGVNL